MSNKNNTKALICYRCQNNAKKSCEQKYTIQKQIEKVSQNESLEAQSLNLGAPPGFEIEGIEPEVNVQNISEETNLDNITTSETVTFFSSLLDNKGNPESDIFDFAKKQAANLYNKYSRSIVTDVSEFVEDIKNMI